MKQKVLTAMSKVLRPLVRIALKNGIMYSEFVGEIRATYLECARAIALENGREPTAARLRLMTGLPSIDVARLASTDANAEADSAGPTGASGNFHTLSATVLSAWHTGPMYTHAYGIPIELPLRDAKESRASRRSLASRIRTQTRKTS